VSQKVQVTEEEGVSLQDFATQQKALLFDTAYLQQDALLGRRDCTSGTPKAGFGQDPRYCVTRLWLQRQCGRAHFTKLTGLFKNFHYATEQSPVYSDLLGRIDGLLSGAADGKGTGEEKDGDHRQGGQNDVA
jgi:V/A-type H+/Na+-transporting ATPase subunit A